MHFALSCVCDLSRSRAALAFSQGSSKSWSDVSQKIIKRQRAAIEKLKADNNALKHELALEVRLRASPPPPRSSGTPVDPVARRPQETSAIPSQSLQQDLARMRESLEIFARKVRWTGQHLSSGDRSSSEQRLSRTVRAVFLPDRPSALSAD